MCASCGCGSPNDEHGDSRNITWNEIQQAAEAGKESPQQAVQNIQKMAQQQSA